MSAADDPVTMLALCGSLRAASRHRELLRAAARLNPRTWVVTPFEGLGSLPLFNPDDQEPLPQPVRRLWDAIESSEALLIASPEYAHGVSGSLKNALDWIVGHPALAYTPTVVLNGSHRATDADQALRLTLRTMSLDLLGDASPRIAVTNDLLDAEGIAACPSRAPLLRAALSALASRARERRRAQVPRGCPLDTPRSIGT